MAGNASNRYHNSWVTAAAVGFIELTATVTTACPLHLAHLAADTAWQAACARQQAAVAQNRRRKSGQGLHYGRLADNDHGM